MAKQHFNQWPGGLNKAKSAHEIALTELAEATNIEYLKNQWQRRPGYSLPYTAISDGFNVTAITDYVRRDQSAHLIVGNKDGLYRLNGTTLDNKLNLSTSVTDKDRWHFAEINNALVACCRDVPDIFSVFDIASANFSAITWDTSTDADGQSGVDIQGANTVVAMNQRLWFGGVTTDIDGYRPEQVRFTDSNAPTRSETTNYINLVGSHSEILTMGLLLNQLLVVYREDLIHLISNPGVPAVALRGTFDIGIIGARAWTTLPGGGHFFVGKEGFYTFTGGQPQSVGDDKMAEYYLGLVSEANLDNVHCWTDKFKKQIHIGVPTGSGIPDKEIVYNWRANVWSEFDRESWCGFYRNRQQTSHSVFLGLESGNIALVDSDNSGDDNGTAIGTLLQPKTWKHIPENNMHESFDTIQVNRVEHDIIETTEDDATIKVAGLDTGRAIPSYDEYDISKTTGWIGDTAMVPFTGMYITTQVVDFESISELIYEFVPSASK